MKGLTGLLIIGTIVFLGSCSKSHEKLQLIGNGETDSLTLNQMQVLASHNSYHLKTDTDVYSFLLNLKTVGLLPSNLDPSGIDYEHAPFEEQFNNYNIRGLELDIHNDPNGGQYYNQQGRYLAGQGTAESFNADLQLPGFKLIHIVDFDYNSLYTTFKQSLQVVKNWSDAHPNHLPIFINVETKEDAPADVLPMLTSLTKAIKFDAEACDKMDEEIKSVFGETLEGVITPDEVRGSYPTLREAALARNWPKLAKARGKVVFIMQGGAESEYKSGHPSLQGRAMFVYSEPNTAEAAFVILNNPVSDFTEIQQRVQEGFIVRTRSDSGTEEARTGDYSGRDAAFTSGAQIISTDYYRPDSRAGTPGWTDFKVQFPNGELARINPVSAADKQDLGPLKE